MEAVGNVEREVNNFLDKLTKFENNKEKEIQELLDKIQEAKDFIAQRKNRHFALP